MWLWLCLFSKKHKLQTKPFPTDSGCSKGYKCVLCPAPVGVLPLAVTVATMQECLKFNYHGSLKVPQRKWWEIYS